MGGRRQREKAALKQDRCEHHLVIRRRRRRLKPRAVARLAQFLVWVGEDELFGIKKSHAAAIAAWLLDIPFSCFRLSDSLLRADDESGGCSLRL
jgi:hypothetical protein